ncbi:hypothetical protein P280DRAFT_238846 [Massarina eburnea CBS 473.64]|uniref:Uncharacterized protein n=1 Tax=Massarina eburnea CBS 473.64 TaxID=1395130 RepID=A0A6A6RKI3_9PLEO|nr:hypothetical protein P280DRAFT_238846 [Massarina eburnea CBS 473.64]
MAFTFYHLLAAISLAPTLIPIAHAAELCKYIYYEPRQDCSFNFDNPGAIFLYTIRSSSFNGYVGVGSCTAPYEWTFACAFNMGSDDLVYHTSVWSAPTGALPATVTVPFSDVPAASLVPGAPVSCVVGAGTTIDYSVAFADQFTLQKNPVPKTQTTTVTVPADVSTTTTTTSTFIETTEKTITPDSVTHTASTGTRTLTKQTTTTKVTTLTPPPRVMNQAVVYYTTTTLSCIPLKQNHSASTSRRVSIPSPNLFLRDEAGEAPTCYISIVTPTITSTQLITPTSTQTYTDIEYQTSTTVSTVTAPAPTSYLRVKSTITTTVTRTRVGLSVVSRRTSSRTTAITNTVTKVARSFALTPCGGLVVSTLVAKPRLCRNPLKQLLGGKLAKITCPGLVGGGA